MTDQYKVGQNNRVFSAAFEVHILFTQAVSLGLVFGFLFTRASVYGKPESENATDFLAKRGVMVPGVPSVGCGNWRRERDIARS